MGYTDQIFQSNPQGSHVDNSATTKNHDHPGYSNGANDTLFVMNFNEQTTSREDLHMLFHDFGELQIDMKRNYAFIQFQTVYGATRAKEAFDGVILDGSKLHVEYVTRFCGDPSKRGQKRKRG